jgi:uncharacterized protein
MNLVRLSRLTGDALLEEMASALSRSFSGIISQSPSSYTWFLCGLDQVLQSQDIVIAGDRNAEDTKALILALRSDYLPSVTVLQISPGSQASAIAEIAPFTRDLGMINGKATAYICSGHACSVPVTDPEMILSTFI